MAYQIRISVLDSAKVSQTWLMGVIKDAVNQEGTFLYERESKIAQETVIEVSGVERTTPRPIIGEYTLDLLTQLLGDNDEKA